MTNKIETLGALLYSKSFSKPAITFSNDREFPRIKLCLPVYYRAKEKAQKLDINKVSTFFVRFSPFVVTDV